MLQMSHNADRVRNAASLTHRYRKGQVVFNAGDEFGGWFEVVSGMIRTCLFDSNGHRQVTGFHHAGDAFGFDTPERTETAEAVCATTLRFFRAADLSDAELRRHRSGEATSSVLQAYQNARRSILVLGRKTAIARVAAFLVATRARLDCERRLLLPMSRSDIGDHLGLTLHTVSRTISDLARRRVIALNGPQSLLILDLDGLCTLAGEDGPPPRTGRPAILDGAESAPALQTA